MNYNDDYHYDSCIAKGICSIGPRTSSLQEMLIAYLRQLAFYALELKNFGGENSSIESVFFNSMSAFLANVESDGEQFAEILRGLKSLLDSSKNTYEEYCRVNDIEVKTIPVTKADDDTNLTELINQGEKEYAKRAEKMSFESKNLFDIIVFISKSLCLNLVELKDYNGDIELYEKGFCSILKLFNLLNFSDIGVERILEELRDSSKIDKEISVRVFELKSKLYGEPKRVKASLSTRQNKAILVAGTNFSELEEVLEFTKDSGVDVYTHGDMILAHTYPKFQGYENLVGHFGQGSEKYLPDFANFPGAILITKYAIENIEYLYRGRLFTTDFYQPKGVVKVIDKDFVPLVEAAIQAKGFKRGKVKPSIEVGTSYDEIDDVLGGYVGRFKRVLVVTPENSVCQKGGYFRAVVENAADDTLVVSFSEGKSCGNVVYLNGFTDFSIVYYVLDRLGIEEVCVYVSKCDKHTIPNIINLKNEYGATVYLTKCSPIAINPALLQMLKEFFGVIVH